MVPYHISPVTSHFTVTPAAWFRIAMSLGFFSACSKFIRIYIGIFSFHPNIIVLALLKGSAHVETFFFIVAVDRQWHHTTHLFFVLIGNI